MSVKVDYMILPDSVVVHYGNTVTTVGIRDKAYREVLELIRTEKTYKIPELIDPSFVIAQVVTQDKEFEIIKGRVFSRGEAVPGYVGDKLLMFAQEKLPVKPLLNFWHRVKGNPSKNSVEQLYRFLEKSKCPLTEDGHFVAYKSVKKRRDGRLFDHHTGKFEYTLGKHATMERAEVVDSPTQACGPGLHVGSYKYADGFRRGGSVILEVLVDPAHVVSVPTDCDSGKLRACSVLPVCVCNEEYDTATVITKEESDANDTHVQGSSAIINRNAYTYAIVADDVFENAVKKGFQVQRLKPSKCPKVVRDMLTVHKAYRVLPAAVSKVPHYYVHTNKDTYYMFTPDDVVEQGVAQAQRKKKPVKKADKPITTGHFTRLEYGFYYITEDECAKLCNQYSVLNVRPSKRPVMIKKTYPDAVYCKRLNVESGAQFIIGLKTKLIHMKPVA